MEPPPLKVKRPLKKKKTSHARRRPREIALATYYAAQAFGSNPRWLLKEKRTEGVKGRPSVKNHETLCRNGTPPTAPPIGGRHKFDATWTAGCRDQAYKRSDQRKERGEHNDKWQTSSEEGPAADSNCREPHKQNSSRGRKRLGADKKKRGRL